MKKLLATLLAVCMAFALTVPTVLADEAAKATDSRVEISFRVGENVLKINNNDVPVETPYVVGEGVTLVPLRVITEAFGAKVGWDDATRTVTLDYPGVNIVLQIGNPIAEVNGKAETLLAAPELPNSSTMVPLRFISETFGATVSYDEATEAILVIKEAEKDSSSTLEGGITNAYVGDSYFGWSMETPKDYELTHRDFSGLNSAFVYNADNLFELDITLLPKDTFNFTAECTRARAKIEGTVLVLNERDPEARTMHVRKTDDTSTHEVYMYATEQYKFVLYGKFENDKPNLRDEALRIMSTFRPTFTEDALDLSTVKDGWRTFESEDMQLSMQIPADYYMSSNEYAYNEFTFAPLSNEDPLSQIHIIVLSKSDTLNAQTLCMQDFSHNQSALNKKYANFSQPTETEYTHIQTYEYDYTVIGFEDAQYTKDAFWDAGDYIFNVAITLKRPHAAPEAFANKILNRIQTGTPDNSRVGTLLRNSLITDEYKTIEGDKWSFEIPIGYAEAHKDNTAEILDPYTGQLIEYLYSEGILESDDIRTKVSQIASRVNPYEKTKTVQDRVKITDGDTTLYLTETTSTVSGRNPIHIFVFGKEDGTNAHFLILEVPEQFCTDSLYNAAIELLKSAKSK